MPRHFLGVMLLTLALVFAASPARALVVAPPTPPVKTVAADLIVTGKILAEEGTVKAPVTPFVTEASTYHVVVLQVTEVIKGQAKDMKVRVGFLDPKTFRPPGSGPLLQLKAGQEGLLYLRKHHAADFYVLPMYGTFVPKQNKAVFDNEIKESRDTLKVMENPLAALKAKDAGQRLHTAQILLLAYQTAPLGATYKQVPIDAEESKLILKTLLEADWDPNKYKGANFRQNPAQLFNTLALTAKEGFQKPNQGLFSPEYAAAAKTWLARNWETFRLQKVMFTSGGS